MTSIHELEKKKEKLQEKLHELDLQYIKDKIDKKEYVDKKFEILNGRFEEDAFRKIDEEIQRLKTRKKAKITIGAVLAILMLTIPFLYMNGMTGFITLDQAETSTLELNETITQTTTKDLSFIQTDQVRVSGKIHGYGQAWIYLKTENGNKLLHYADTRQSQVTGMVTNGKPVNQSKGKADEKNQTSNANQTVNSTSNTSNANQTVNGTSNETTTNTTLNQTINNETITNQTANSTSNTTNTASNTSSEATNQTIFKAAIQTSKDTYNIGDNVSINVTPENSSYTLYMHAPDDTYILNEEWWIAQVSGNHTTTAIVSQGNKTDRASKTFKVLKPQTATFTERCVETCQLAETEEVVLEIVVNNTEVHIDNLTYTPTETVSNTTQKNTSDTNSAQNTSTNSSSETDLGEAKGKGAGQATPSQRKCLLPNPNARPKECFSQEEWENKFPTMKFRLINDLGKEMAWFDGEGNLHIQGNVVEQSTSTSNKYDFDVRGKGQSMIWIDALSGDLHLRGDLYENQETLNWQTRQDYVVNNRKGMYLGVFRADTGDLYLRGEVVNE